MSYKEVDKIFENWRRSTYSLPPISNHFAEKQQLNENWRDKLFQLMTAAGIFLGTAVTWDYLKDLERESKERIEQQDQVDLDSMDEAQKYHYLLKKEIEKEIKNNPNLTKVFSDPKSEMYSVFKTGLDKGKVDRVAVMHKYAKKYSEDLNITDNGNYVYIEPGAIDSDDVLPMMGVTAGQYRQILSSDKNFMELTRVAMGNPDSWVYGKDITRQFAMIEFQGQYKNVLPLDWSIAMDMATAKGQQFMEEIASNAFELDPETGLKNLNPEKFKKIKSKYGIYNNSDYQKAMWSLNDFVKTNTHSVWDQIEDFAGVSRLQDDYDPKLLRGFDVDPDTLPLGNSLNPPEGSNRDNLAPIHIQMSNPIRTPDDPVVKERLHQT